MRYGANVRLEVDSAVLELAERSSLLELGSLLGVLYASVQSAKNCSVPRYEAHATTQQVPPPFFFLVAGASIRNCFILDPLLRETGGDSHVRIRGRQPSLRVVSCQGIRFRCGLSKANKLNCRWCRSFGKGAGAAVAWRFRFSANQSPHSHFLVGFGCPPTVSCDFLVEIRLGKAGGRSDHRSSVFSPAADRTFCSTQAPICSLPAPLLPLRLFRASLAMDGGIRSCLHETTAIASLMMNDLTPHSLLWR